MDVLKSRGYQTFERLDQGGQANVYKTSKNGEIYAIKVVKVDNPDAQLDDDLKRELQIVRNLKHPNCIQVEEIFRTKNKIYIIMDFMPNGTIGDMSRKHGPFCEWNTKLWFCPIARAIMYLHEHKIAHRDLKLDNVLLDGFLNPIVTDFGFSRFVRFDRLGKVKKSETYCGTTSYNPPEILSKTPYDPFKGDIWCCGVMLFIMINQIYPFDKNDMDKMYVNQITRAYKLQPHIEARISNELKDLIRCQLEPKPTKRPNINQVCEHVWFPVILKEFEYFIKKPKNEKQYIGFESE